MLPFAVPIDRENFVFEKLELNETGIYGYKLSHKNYEDWLILSDGKNHQFTDKLSGDFSFGWFRWQNGILKKLSVVNTSNLNLPGSLTETFVEKKNFEIEF